MRKLLFILAIVLVPMMASAVKIEKNEIDEFTGMQTVTTSWETLDKGRIHVRFRFQGDKQFLDFKYVTREAIVIPSDASLMFKSDDGSIDKFSATQTFLGGIGDGATGMAGSAALGIYAHYTGDIGWFSSNTTVLMRIYRSDAYEDKKISDKDAKKLRELADLFLTTISHSEG